MTPEELYWELNRVLSSKHSDNPEDTANAIAALENAMRISRFSPEEIINKCRQMKDRLIDDGSMIPKLSVAINGRFWEKHFVEQIPFRPFVVDASRK